MMLAVAFAVLAGPALAQALGRRRRLDRDRARRELPAPARPRRHRRARRRRRPRRRAAQAAGAARYADARGVHAGWIVSACVLAGHWTVLTRIAEAVGSDGLGHGPTGPAWRR